MSTGSRNGHAILCACRGGRDKKNGNKDKERRLRKLKPMKKNKQHHENYSESRWVNTDVLSHFLSHFTDTHTGCWTEEEKIRGEEREKKGKPEKTPRPGSCPSRGSQTHQIRRTQRTFCLLLLHCNGATRSYVSVFPPLLIIKLQLQSCWFRYCLVCLCTCLWPS